MLLGRGLGGPKPKAWAKAEAQKLNAFFARQEERQRSGGGAAELEWAYSTDGEDTHHARVPVGGLVKHVTLGLFGTVLQKGSGADTTPRRRRRPHCYWQPREPAAWWVALLH